MVISLVEYPKEVKKDKVILRNYLETQSSRKILLLWNCGLCA
jgi:hypothetical protein